MAASAAQLNYGKYFGSLQMDGKSSQLAIALDAFQTQVGDPISNPNDPNNYPQVNVILRVNLGGFFGSEYVSYHYYKPPFNFEQGVLQLDDAENDLSATLTVTNDDSVTTLEGPVVYRPTGAQGHLKVVMDSDGFNAARTGARPGVPFQAKAAGEFRGQCDGQGAALEVETGRGVGGNTPGNALNGYAITGRLGYESTCSMYLGLPSPVYCSLFAFSSGLYDPYDDHLTLEGPAATIDCSRSLNAWQCTLRALRGTQHCTLEAPSAPATPAAQYPREFYLKVPAEGMKALPPLLPPANTELIQKLQGNFYGFLHHENRDLYQPIAMNVVATASTRKRHIPNQVMVTPTVSAFLGASWETRTALTTRLPQRLFNLNTGFALQSLDGDNFLVVGDWRRGYLRGVWYSRSYGRVGTFELQKGTRPPVPPKMKLLSDFDGEFEGPIDGQPWMDWQWWLRITIRNQNAGAGQSSLNLIGQYVLKDLTPVAAFDAGSFDPNTGSLTLLMKTNGDRLLTGDVVSHSRLGLSWPSGPDVLSSMASYGRYLFGRVTRE